MGDDDEEPLTVLIEQIRQLRIQQDRILDRIEATAQQQRRTQQEATDYQVGNRVYVVNRIRRPVFAKASWTATAERRATVTKVVGSKVHFKTDNGTVTWRSRENIRLLDSSNDE